MPFSARQNQQAYPNLLMQPPALPNGHMSTERPIASSLWAQLSPTH